MRGAAVQARQPFGAALLEVRRLAWEVRGAPLCTLRAGHLYALQEFLEVQVPSPPAWQEGGRAWCLQTTPSRKSV